MEQAGRSARLPCRAAVAYRLPGNDCRRISRKICRPKGEIRRPLPHDPVRTDRGHPGGQSPAEKGTKQTPVQRGTSQIGPAQKNPSPTTPQNHLNRMPLGWGQTDALAGPPPGNWSFLTAKPKPVTDPLPFFVVLRAPSWINRSMSNRIQKFVACRPLPAAPNV